MNALTPSSFMAGVTQSSLSVAEDQIGPQWYARGIVGSEVQWRHCRSLLPCIGKSRPGDSPSSSSDHGDLNRDYRSPTPASHQSSRELQLTQSRTGVWLGLKILYTGMADESTGG